MIASPPPLPVQPPIETIRVAALPDTTELEGSRRLVVRARGLRWKVIRLAILLTIVLSFFLVNGLFLMVGIVLSVIGVATLRLHLIKKSLLRESLAKRAMVSRPEEWEFSPLNANRRFGLNHSRYDWSMYELLIASDAMLVLQPDVLSLYCIPMRFFELPADAAKVVDWASLAGVRIKDFRTGRQSADW